MFGMKHLDPSHEGRWAARRGWRGQGGPGFGWGGRHGMGGGDIKLLAMIGAFLGWPSIPVTLFVASVLGSVIGVGLMVATGAGRRLALPFAPFLCSGALIYLFYGEALIRFYLPSS